MPMTRQQLRHQAAIARYKAEKQKPASRKQLSAWLDPSAKRLLSCAAGKSTPIGGIRLPAFTQRMKTLPESIIRLMDLSEC